MITIFGIAINDFFKKKENTEQEPDFSGIGKALGIDYCYFDAEKSSEYYSNISDFLDFIEDLEDECYQYPTEVVEAIELCMDKLLFDLNNLKRYIAENRKED